MRQFAGYGSAFDTPALQIPARTRTDGASTPSDLPTLMGSTRHPFSEGEVGKCGVATAVARKDMETLFNEFRSPGGRPRMDDNAPALDDLRLLPGGGRKTRGRMGRRRRHAADDILKEYNRAERVDLSAASLDAADHRHVQVSAPSECQIGIRSRSPVTTSAKPGRPPPQELAFTLRDGIEYVEYGVRAGLDVDEFAPRLSFFSTRIRLLRRDRQIPRPRAASGTGDDRAFKGETRAPVNCASTPQTAGVSLTVQQPIKHISRVAIQALAAVLGGAQIAACDGYDEALASTEPRR